MRFVGTNVEGAWIVELFKVTDNPAAGEPQLALRPAGSAAT